MVFTRPRRALSLLSTVWVFLVFQCRTCSGGSFLVSTNTHRPVATGRTSTTGNGRRQHQVGFSTLSTSRTTHWHSLVPVISSTALEAKKKGDKRPKGFGKSSSPRVESSSSSKKKQSSSKTASSSPTATSAGGGGGGGGGTPLQSVQGGSNSIPTITTPTSTSQSQQQQQQQQQKQSSSSSLQDKKSDIPIDPNLPVEERTSKILREKYGLRTYEEQQQSAEAVEKQKQQKERLQQLQKLAKDEDDQFDLFAILPPSLLTFIDGFLKLGLTLTTIVFVIAGIGITAEAWSAASGNPLPSNIDDFIVTVVEPNFTKGLVVLLGFSISLGLFAAAQLGSESTRYQERDGE